MGVRLYSSGTGRFLSADPVRGGNANSYSYPTDPVNVADLDGRHGDPYYLCFGNGRLGDSFGPFWNTRKCQDWWHEDPQTFWNGLVGKVEPSQTPTWIISAACFAASVAAFSKRVTIPKVVRAACTALAGIALKKKIQNYYAANPSKTYGGGHFAL